MFLNIILYSKILYILILYKWLDETTEWLTIRLIMLDF